jgi:adenosylcobyric acid synthase
VNIDIDDEDSLSERLSSKKRKEIDIAVIALPRISNFTDFSPFERFSGVSLRYIRNAAELCAPDLIIIPGTKSTISDLKWMRQKGLEAEVLKASSRGTPVFGVCGGLQMLGKSISDPFGSEGGGVIAGMGLLDIETVFGKEKTRTQVEGSFCGINGILNRLDGLKYRGYEIHMGQSNGQGAVLQNDNIYGSYIHGLFDEADIARTIVEALYKRKGLPFDESAVFDPHAYREEQYDKLADIVRSALDMRLVYSIVSKGCV